jgi:hypothetical protein
MVHESYVFTTQIGVHRVNATCTFYNPISNTIFGHGITLRILHSKWTILFPLGLAVPILTITYGRNQKKKQS